MEPGDMIEWTYKYSEDLVHENEILWSWVEGRYVPIGSGMVHILVSIDDKTLSWSNAEGVFYARVDDSAPVRPWGRGPWVVPRTRANP